MLSHRLKPILHSALLLFAVTIIHAQDPSVLVYGATPAGIAAAIAAAEDGEKVLLIEPTDRIGGMIACGLSHADFRTREGLTGAYLKFTQRVEQHYRDAFGADSPQVRDCWGGVFAEPKVNLAVFEKMIAAQPNITLWKNRRVLRVGWASRLPYSASRGIHPAVERGSFTS